MHKHIPKLLIAVAMASAFNAGAASNEDITRRHFASLVSGGQPRTAELTMFFTLMPKGGDLHHHYSGAIYAEQFLEWVDKQNYCVNKGSYQIETNAAAVAAQRARAAADRTCLSGEAVMQDNAMLAELLQRWATKDFHNHGGQQTPPDRTFFDTFGYFNPVASTNTADGLRRLKQRAINENLGYIETVFELAPMASYPDFDQAVLAAGADSARLNDHFETLMAALDKDAAWKGWTAAYNANVDSASAGIDDERFTMRYQPFVLRFLSPSQVFSSMVSSFKLALQNPKVVGVNIVGQESTMVSMRDYTLHMRMFKFLKAKHPEVKLALHAGELSLGMVPPEGLQSHIAEAVEVAGASRIGHGMDIAHERDPVALMKKMRARGVPVEVNLTSNEFILGVKGDAHPVTLYRKYGVPFVLATDDAGVSRNNLSNEYVLYASRYKTDYAEVKKLSYDSIRYSFLAEQDKRRLLKALDGKFARFEADVASSLHSSRK
ncbi:adenosine deaminase family protein [Pseudoduganella namucuonensis]|uniref:adenosine deaminase n=1 Tax=Pseudoduganella namucuonensis TaxID=1035707 RepID=A0A1I7F206_9BURK|nr:adenosine deaminase [Pseudoduganella namucuonensis]SFU30144.1 adenosine deaminase [Pseudoduganella namucuonensis]